MYRGFFGTEGKMDYLLKFNKQVMGLNELNAKSTCLVDVSFFFEIIYCCVWNNESFSPATSSYFVCFID